MRKGRFQKGFAGKFEPACQQTKKEPKRGGGKEPRKLTPEDWEARRKDDIPLWNSEETA